MKHPIKLAAALAVVALAPQIASADLILDTGTPPPSGTPSVVFNSSGWYAAEFSVTAGETITQLSAYLTKGLGSSGGAFTFDIYSAAGTFIGANREQPSFTTGGTYTADGWNSATVNWTPSTAGNYWLAIQMTSSQGPGFNLPLESSTTTGTAPALAFAQMTSLNRYALETGSPVGLEVTAVPLPGAALLFGSGLLGFGSMLRRRRA